MSDKRSPPPRSVSQSSLVPRNRSRSSLKGHDRTKSTADQLGAPSRWMGDEESENCLQCGKGFGVTRRRHHCRQCGRLVCASCSSNSFVLPHTRSMDAVRVCDSCFSSLTTSMEGEEGGEGGGAGNKKNYLPNSDGVLVYDGEDEGEDEIDRKLHVPDVPTWSYILKPFTEEGEKVVIGRLYCKVLRAIDLPAANFFSGTSDPYCKLKVSESQAKTKTIMKTTKPVWNEEFFLDVTNATAQLKIDIFDFEAMGNDNLLGTVHIPLGELTHQLRFRKWIEVQVSDEVKNSAEGQKAEKLKKLNETKEEHEKEAVAVPQIYLELQYKFSKIGEFFSSFNPEKAEKEEDDNDFNIDTIYGQAMRLLTLLAPLFAFFGLIGSVIAWTHPYVSMLVLLSWIYVTLNPWTFLVLIHILLIRYMCFQYVYRLWDRAAEREALKNALKREQEEQDAKKNQNIFEMAGKGLLNVGKGVVSAVPLIPIGKEKKENKKEKEKREKEQKALAAATGTADDQLHLNAALRSVLNGTLAAAGLHSSLGYYQRLLSWICDLIQMIYDFFQFRSAASKGVLFGLIGSLIYCIFLPQNYLFLVVGCYVLTCQTRPLQLILWLILGLIRYLTRPAPSAKTHKKRKVADVPPISSDLSSSSSSSSSKSGDAVVNEQKAQQRLKALQEPGHSESDVEHVEPMLAEHQGNSGGAEGQGELAPLGAPQ